MNYLPYVELFTAAYLLFIGFSINTTGVFYMLVIRVFPSVLVVLLLIDAVSRLGWMAQS